MLLVILSEAKNLGFAAFGDRTQKQAEMFRSA
jgi:hypothetical protein